VQEEPFWRVSRGTKTCLVRRVRPLFDDHVIDRTQIARVYVINTDASPGFDCGLDDFARFVHNATGTVENVTARTVRGGLANNERFDRLITGSPASSVVIVTIVPVTATDSVEVPPCFLPFDPACANASSVISMQVRVTIVFFMIMLPC
jgi:hypothetical protein